MSEPGWNRGLQGLAPGSSTSVLVAGALRGRGGGIFWALDSPGVSPRPATSESLGRLSPMQSLGPTAHLSDWNPGCAPHPTPHSGRFPPQHAARIGLTSGHRTMSIRNLRERTQSSSILLFFFFFKVFFKIQSVNIQCDTSFRYQMVLQRSVRWRVLITGALRNAPAAFCF